MGVGLGGLIDACGQTASRTVHIASLPEAALSSVQQRTWAATEAGRVGQPRLGRRLFRGKPGILQSSKLHWTGLGPAIIKHLEILSQDSAFKSEIPVLPWRQV